MFSDLDLSDEETFSISAAFAVSTVTRFALEEECAGLDISTINAARREIL